FRPIPIHLYVVQRLLTSCPTRRSSDLSGKSLTDVVGSYPIGFNMERGLTYTSYGYPAGAPYDGEQLYYCTDTASQDSRGSNDQRSEEHTSELQSRFDLVCRLLLEKKKK